MDAEPLSGLSADAVRGIKVQLQKKVGALVGALVRNDDEDAGSSALATHGAEVREVMTSAQSMIRDAFVGATNRRESTAVTEAIEKLTAQHESEKEAALDQFVSFKQHMKEREVEMKRSAAEKINEISRDALQLKKETTDKVAQLVAARDAMIAAHKQEVSELQSTHDGALRALREEMHSAYEKRMQAAMGDQQGALSEQQAASDALLKAERAAAEEILSRVRQQLSASEETKAVLAARVADLESKTAADSREIGELTDNVSSLTKDLANADAARNTAEAQVVNLKAEVESVRRALAELETKLSASMEELARTNGALQREQDHHQQALRKLKAAESSHAELQALLKAEQMEKTHVAKQLDASRAKLKSVESTASAASGEKAGLLTEISELQKSRDKLRRELEERETQVAYLKREVAESKLALEEAGTKTAEQLKAQNDRWSKEVDMWRSRYDALSQDKTAAHKKTVAELEEQLRGANAALEAAKKDYEGRLREASGQHAAVLADRVKEHEKQLAALREKYARLEASKSEGNAAAEATSQALRKQLGDAQAAFDIYRLKSEADQKELEGKIFDLEAAKRDLESLVESTRQEAAAQAAALKSQLGEGAAAVEKELATVKRLQELLAQQEAETRALEATVSRKEAELGAMQRQLDDLQRQLGDLQRQYNAKMSQSNESLNDVQLAARKAEETLRAEMEALRSRLTLAHQAELDRVRMAHAGKVKDLVAHHGGVVDKLKREVSEHEAAAEKLHATLEMETKKLESLLLDAKGEAAELRRDSGRTAVVNAEFGERAMIHEEWTNCFEQVYHNFSLALQETRLKDAHRSAMQKVVDDHNSELALLSDEARRGHSDLEDMLKNRIASLERRKDEERASAVRELTEKHRRELAAALQSNADEITRLSGKVSVLTKEKDIALQSYKASEILARDMQQQLVQEQQVTAELKRRLDALLRESKAAYDAAAQQHGDELNAQVSSLTRRHKAEVEKLCAVHADQVGKLKQQLHEWEHRYAHRESRPEDVKRINSLIAELKDKDDAIVKAYHDMKFYKLELANREESYNKVFGRQPSVAEGRPPVAPTMQAAPSTAFVANGGEYAGRPRANSTTELVHRSNGDVNETGAGYNKYKNQSPRDGIQSAGGSRLQRVNSMTSTKRHY